MTDDDMKRKFEFLLEQQAQFAAQMSALQQQFDSRMRAQQERFDSQQQRLDTQQERLSIQQERTSAGLEALAQQVSSVIEEMREGFNNLIVANKVIRDLAQQTALLATQNSR